MALNLWLCLSGLSHRRRLCFIMSVSFFIVLFVCLLVLIICYCMGVCSCSSEDYQYYTKVGPKYPPSQGEVWPTPHQEQKTRDYFVFHSSKFEFVVTNESCGILTRAIDRYKQILLSDVELIIPRHLQTEHINQSTGVIKRINIQLLSKCEMLPHYDMDEKYSIIVGRTSTLKSKSIWGILRGLETFTQLFYFADDYSEIRINATIITDYPEYKHRGLLIDTGRHFLSLSNIYKTIEALAMNKMNVLHWHLVDDQSFPLQSERYPTLSQKGAFYPTMIYTKADIHAVVEFARDRGVRVIPEIDVPGHTLSWGEAFPDLLTECYSDNKVVGHGPLNPTKTETYEFIEQILDEVHHWFPDEFLHLGGDEVQTNCWASNPNIQDFMKKNHIVTNKLQAFFMQRTLTLLPNRTRPLVWQEVFDMDALPQQKTHVQVWNWNWVKEMVKILNAGHYVIFSASWYLDYGNQGWEDYYREDPRWMVYLATKSLTGLKNIVGGEACLWGEMADDTNLLSKSWPRTSAIAERLWSGLPYDYAYECGPCDYDPVDDKVRARIEEHTCRMRRRGIAAAPPNGPSFCAGAKS